VRFFQPKPFVIFLASFLVLSMNGIAQNSLQIIHGQKPAATDKLKPQGRYASTNHLDLALGLPLRDHAGLSALLRDLYDPASPSYHKYITSRQFAERFGPSVGDYRKLADFATGHGLKIMGTHDNRTLLDVSGSAGDIEKAFHVRMQVYQHPTECRTFHAPDGDPSIDLDLPVLGVYGLDNYVVPRPMNLKSAFDSTNAPTFASGSGPGGNYIGYDFRAAYAPGVSLTGAGQTVGLLEFDGYYPSDIAQYLSVAKLPNVPITNRSGVGYRYGDLHGAGDVANDRLRGVGSASRRCVESDGDRQSCAAA
jgi:subtilase family serine protease